MFILGADLLLCCVLVFGHDCVRRFWILGRACRFGIRVVVASCCTCFLLLGLCLFGGRDCFSFLFFGFCV